MTKTEQKEIVAKVKAKLAANGGRVVNTAAVLGVTTVTLNNVLHGQRLYRKSWAKLAKAVGVKLADEPKTGVRKIAKPRLPQGKKAKKSGKKKASKKVTKAAALASIKKAVKTLKTAKPKAVKETAAAPAEA